MDRNMTRRGALGALASTGLTVATFGASRAATEPEDVVRRFLDAIAAADLDAGAALLTDDYDPHDDDAEPGPGAWRQRRRTAEEGLRNAFDKVEYVTDDLITEQETVAYRGRVRLSNDAGKTTDVLVLSVFRVEDGKIAESWSLSDQDAALEALTD